MKRKLNIFLAVFLILVLIGSLAACAENVEKKTEKDYSNVVENPNITIPGYESISFKAGKTTQNVNFYNPEENTCFFRMSLILKNPTETVSTEDGNDEKEKILWTSEFLEPGEHITSIKLEKKLESGAYAASLRYECFSVKDETPLNGSQIDLVLNVNS